MAWTNSFVRVTGIEFVLILDFFINRLHENFAKKTLMLFLIFIDVIGINDYSTNYAQNRDYSKNKSYLSSRGGC